MQSTAQEGLIVGESDLNDVAIHPGLQCGMR